MTSAKRVVANRENAQVSTGPRTEAGKAIAALNATKHGLTATSSVVVPEIEDAADWERHYEATIHALQPVGHIEMILAERVAAQSWRLVRATRYETQMIKTAQETIEYDLNEHRRFMRGRLGETHPEDVRESLNDAKTLQRVLKRFPDMPDDAPMKPAETGRLLWSAEDVVDVEIDWVAVLDLPEDEEPYEPEAVTGFTAGRVRQCLNEIASAAGISIDLLMRDLREHADLELRTWRMRVNDTEIELERMRRDRTLPLDDLTHEKLQRYETSIERSLHRTLHQLERMQEKRAGGHVPSPVVIDVNVDGIDGTE